MKYTSAQANKLLKKLNSEYRAILWEESKSDTFLAAMGEKPEEVRPEYDYTETQKNLKDIQRSIIKLKHAINLFNVSHTLPGFDLTVDEALVYIPQLSAHVRKLSEMKGRLPKARETQQSYSRTSVIDYRYINYDKKTVSEDYDKAFDELSALQTALDTLNNSDTFEIDI